VLATSPWAVQQQARHVCCYAIRGAKAGTAPPAVSGGFFVNGALGWSWLNILCSISVGQLFDQLLSNIFIEKGDFIIYRF